jgi:tetratricopeptide (TPR) repeat protein
LNSNASRVDLALYRSNLATVYAEQGKLAEAEDLIEQVLADRTADLGPLHEKTLHAQDWLAKVYAAQKRYGEAERLYREVIAGRSTMLGPRHGDTTGSRSSLAFLYWQTRRYELAIPAYEEVLAACKECLPANHPETLSAAANLAVNLRDAGRLADAELLADEWLPLWRKQLVESKGQLFGAWTAVSIYDKTGHFAKAEPVRRDLAEFQRQRSGATSLPYLVELTAMGENLLEQKKWSQAEPILRECLAIRQETHPDDWQTFRTQSLLGAALFGQQKLDEAEPLLLAAYTGMLERRNSIPEGSRQHLIETIQRLIDLYTAWNKPAETEKWKSEADRSER